MLTRMILGASALLLAGCLEGTPVSAASDPKPESASMDPGHKLALEAMGLRADMAREAGEYYVVEGDIRIPKARLEGTGIGKSAQQRTTMLASIPNADEISIVFHPDVNSDWRTATRQAMAEWNSLGTRVRLVEATGFPASAIFVVQSFNIGATALADFPHSGIAGDDITIDSTYNYLLPGDKKWVMTHEIGHCLGLRHTNWLTRTDPWGNPTPEPVNDPWYNDPSYHVSGTPSNSTPDASSIMWATFTIGAGWNGFSWWDIYALRTMYTDTRYYRRADFDADGKNDLLFFNPPSNSIHLRFATGGVVATSFGNANGQMMTGDLNGDGRSEIWFANRATQTVTSRTWNGSSFTSPSMLILPGAFGSLTGGSFYNTLDFDGDGRTDLLFYNASSSTIHLRKSTGLSLNSGSTYVTSFGNVDGQFIIGDFSGDGKDDIAWANRATNEVQLRVSNGSMFYSAVTIVPANHFGHLSGGGFYLAANVNGSGGKDLVFFEPGNNTFYARMSTGLITPGTSNVGFSGTFTLMTFGNINGQFLVHDYNYDGREDILFADRGSNSVQSWMNGPMGFLPGGTFICSNCYGDLQAGGFYR